MSSIEWTRHKNGTQTAHVGPFKLSVTRCGWNVRSIAGTETGIASDQDRAKEAAIAVAKALAVEALEELGAFDDEPGSDGDA